MVAICILFVAFICFVMYVPCIIADKRNLEEDEKSTIKLLCHLGWVVPFCWIFALIKACFGKKEK